MESARFWFGVGWGFVSGGVGCCVVLLGWVFSCLLSGSGRLLTPARGRHSFFSLLETACCLLIARSPYFAFHWRIALGLLVVALVVWFVWFGLFVFSRL